FPVLHAPTVVGVHDTTAQDHPELLFATRRERVFWRVKESLAIRRASRLFTVSAASREAVRDAFGIDGSRVTVVPEAPDPVFSPRDPDDIADARHSIGLDPDETFVLYAAGISPHKNVGSLVDAFARVRAPAKLVLAGDLEDGYLSAAGSVRRRIT